VATRVITLATACAVVLADVGAAQSSKDTATSRGSAAVVSSIQIRRENVFDKSEETAMRLARVANRLHVLTREHVVQRELLIRQGQPFDSATAAETARNLRKLDIFRQVAVDSATTDSGLVEQVTTRDAWTTILYLTFKSSADQVVWGVGLTEKNLLGRQIRTTVRYTKDPDRSTLQLSASLPRIVRNRVGMDGSFDQLSDGKRARFTVSAPFVSQSTRQMMSFDAQYKDADVLRFFEGEEEASDTVRQLMSSATLSGGWATRASTHGYVRLGGGILVRREDFLQEAAANVDRSFFGELGLIAEASRSNLAVVRDYRSIAVAEDVDLSRTVRVGVYVAPSAWGYERNGLGPMLSVLAGKTFSKGFAFTQIRASSLFTSAGLDSGSATVGAVLALQPAPRHSAVLNASLGWQKNPYPGEEFDLGLTFGPRGFPAHAFTGDRAFFTTAEYRWVVSPSVFSLFALGVAAFADYGGAWYNGSPRRTGTDVGGGLRLGPTRTGAPKGATRIDLAYRFANDVLPGKWVIAIGTGLPFERQK